MQIRKEEEEEEKKREKNHSGRRRKKDMRDDSLGSVNKAPDSAAILCGAGESWGWGGGSETRRLRGDDKRPSAGTGKRLSAGRIFISVLFLPSRHKRGATPRDSTISRVRISMSETFPPQVSLQHKSF